MTVLAIASPPPLRHSRLKLMGEAPAKFLSDQEREAQFFEKGTGAHSVLLGGKRPVVWDKKSEKGNQCPRKGADFDAFEALNQDALILLPGEYDQVQGMAESVQKNADAMALLAGRKERTLFWTLDGRACRGTPDVDNGHSIVELKTAKSSNPRDFYWDSRRYCYPGALAWYMDGAALQFGRRVMPEEAYIVAVESAKPYIVTVFRVPQSEIDEGRRQNRAWFERLQWCEANGVWPGYATGIVDLDRPTAEQAA
jgi:hypothetical protein